MILKYMGNRRYFIDSTLSPQVEEFKISMWDILVLLVRSNIQERRDRHGHK